VLTLDQLKWVIAPLPRTTRVDEVYPWLEPLFETYDFSTPQRQAAFLAQTAHETGRYRWLEEIASGDAYDTRTDLGNTPEEDGDGALYKGRGLIQITGRANYAACSLDIFSDERLLEAPEILADPQYAVLSAGWYWSKKGLNRWADAADLINLTRRINGGLNGWEDRQALYKRATYAFGLWS
jgi:putative chitinase